MKEIGGYLELEHFQGDEYHNGLLALNNGRSALHYLIMARQIKKLYIPLFLCDSVSNLCDRYEMPYEHYGITRNFLPAFKQELAKDEWLYIVNYYGQLSNDTIQKLKAEYDRVIVDNVQAFFQAPVSGVDTIYSCRKFFGVPDGSYLSTDARLEESLEQDVSGERMRHILGRYEGCASDFYTAFKENDASFAVSPARMMSSLTHNLLRAIDYDYAIRKRNENYAVLAEALDGDNPLELTVPKGPFCYPYYHKNGPEIRKRLAAQKIYIATLWPNLLDLDDCLEKDYAKNILPIPCDQRYDEEDMKRILNALTEFA